MTHYAVLTDAGDLKFEFEPQQRAFCLKTYGAGAYLDVDIREHREKRSERQNRGFHAMLEPWAREYPIEQLKRDLLEQIFGTFEHVSPIDGLVRHILVEPHTSKLNVQKFSHLIEETLRIAAEQGFLLTAPDEYRIAKEAAARQAARAAKKASKAA